MLFESLPSFITVCYISAHLPPNIDSSDNTVRYNGYVQIFSMGISMFSIIYGLGGRLASYYVNETFAPFWITVKSTVTIIPDIVLKLTIGPFPSVAFDILELLNSRATSTEVVMIETTTLRETS